MPFPGPKFRMQTIHSVGDLFGQEKYNSVADIYYWLSGDGDYDNKGRHAGVRCFKRAAYLGVLLDFSYIRIAKNKGYDFQRLATEK